MPSVEDYPYDPRARVEQLEGLDKLRAIENRDHAAMLYELYWVAEANEDDEAFLMRETRNDKRRREDNYELLSSSTAKALKGTYGARAKKLAEEITKDGALVGLDTMLLLRRKLRRLEGRESG